MVVRASSVMSRGVVTVTPESRLDDARALLTNNRFSALPVVDRAYRLVGIVSTLDVLRADAEGRRHVRVGAVMTPDPMTMGPDSPVTILSRRVRRRVAFGRVALDVPDAPEMRICSPMAGW